MPRSRSRSRDSEDSLGDFAVKPFTAKRHRKYRRKDEKPKPASLTLSADTIASLEVEIEQKVQAAVKEADVATRIQERLVQERARLEAELEAKITEERRLQLLRKRREMEQHMHEQAELERILAENQKKLEQAKTDAAKREPEASGKAEKMHSLNSRISDIKGAQLGEDVVILGRTRTH